MKAPLLALLAALFAAPAAFGASPPAPRSFAYVLQADAFAPSRATAVRRLAACDRDWIILDVAFDGAPGGAWTPREIRTIRNGRPDRRVLAYLSIGEAEDFRAYWRRAWDANRDGRPDPGAPAWLGNENPDWPGNYAVRYWQRPWQDIVLAQLNAIVRAGFDGVYLDLVDAFESFEYNAATGQWIDHRRNPETGRTYRRDMIAWVQRVAARARATRPAFLVVPQNGVQLLGSAAYRDTLSAIGVEDLFTLGNQPQPRDHVAYSLAYLRKLAPLRKPVLVIEYGTRPASWQRSLRGAAQNGFTLLLTDRNLCTLGASGTP